MLKVPVKVLRKIITTKAFLDSLPEGEQTNRIASARTKTLHSPLTRHSQIGELSLREINSNTLHCMDPGSQRGSSAKHA